jgi:hypothetical protein
LVAFNFETALIIFTSKNGSSFPPLVACSEAFMAASIFVEVHENAELECADIIYE